MFPKALALEGPLSYGDREMVEPQAATQPQAPGRDRFLLAIVGGTLLLVLVSVVVVLFFSRPRPAAPVDPASPAGVVQAYLEALRVGDFDTARGYLTRSARADSIARERSPYTAWSGNNNVRVVVETTSMTETTADVKVTISRFQARSDPFSSSTYHRDVTVRLLKEDGEWRINSPSDTYTFYY